jgi:prepilin-type N-terminal cleavage/methylation domain-containing protein
MSKLTAAVNRLRSQRGYSLVEMLTVLSILGVVSTSVTTVFVAGANSEIDMNRRFQAQNDARVALDRLRRDAHCAKTATPTGTSASVTLTLESYCKDNGSITWCTIGSGQRYKLHRSKAAPCDAADPKFADFLTRSTLFAFTAQSTASLAKLHVELPVDLKPSDGLRGYELRDDLTLRNSVRQ